MSMNSKKTKLPQISRWLFSVMKRYDEEFVWAGDLEEEFNQIMDEKGSSKARHWYRRQVFKTIPTYLRFLMQWGTIMSKHYLITAIRHMKRQKSFTVINVVGLAIGLTFFILIMIYFAVMEWLGFYFSAFLFFVAATFVLGRKDLTLRKGGVRVGIAFIFTAVLFVLFNKLLVVQTPKGMFF